MPSIHWLTRDVVENLNQTTSRSRQPLSFTQLHTYGSFESNFDQRLVVFPSGLTENKFLVLGNYWKAESAHDNTQRVKTAKICSVRPYIKLFNEPHIGNWFIIIPSFNRIFLPLPSLKGIQFLRICSVLGASGDWLGLQNVNIAREEEEKLDFSSDSIKYM